MIQQWLLEAVLHLQNLSEKDHRWKSGYKNGVSQKCPDIYAVIRVLKIDLFIDLSRLQHPSSSSALYCRMV